METIVSTESLKKAESLYYGELRETEDIIKKYPSRYNEEAEFALSSLESLRNKLRDTLLELFLKDNINKLEDVINENKDKLKKLNLFALLEISHRKSVGIKFKIGSPLFFQKLRKDYRELMQESNEIQERLSQPFDEKEMENTKLKLEKLVERLKNLDYELEEERRTGTYNFLGKILVWSIPILIGIYQLIAMQYFIINPLTLLVVYIVAIAIVYLILQTNYIKIILSGLETKKEYFAGTITWLICLTIIYFFMNDAVQKGNLVGAILVIIFALIVATISLKSKYDENKQTFIKKELEPIKRFFQEL
ncbi:MAG: hypothetical protein O8C61_11775 [Candidatus Methanoperedens sp.]|nr:hypothetical protein [Candidatus Methanoperedens sp.]